jgi:hypothetical protein
MIIGENMAEAATDAYPGHMTLAEFLDTLPRTPCEQIPQNKYFCTVCERLNKGVAARCRYSKVEGEAGAGQTSADAGSVDFIPVADGKGAPDKLEPATGIGAAAGAQNDTEKVEFKVVAPLKSADDFPMLELVQPKDKQIKPIEMELLENVAIEFTAAEDMDIDSTEAVEVEALEVEPIEGDDEYAEADIGLELGDAGGGTDEDSAFEVEALEVAELAVDEEDFGEHDESIPQFTPLNSQGAHISDQGPVESSAPTTMATEKSKVKKKTVKRKKVSKPKTQAPTFTPITPSAAQSPTPTQTPSPTPRPQATHRPTTTGPTQKHQTSPQVAGPRAASNEPTVPRFQPQTVQPRSASAPTKLQPVRKTKPKKVKKVVKKK